MCIFIFLFNKYKQQSRNSDDTHHFAVTIIKIPRLSLTKINSLTFQVSGNPDTDTDMRWIVWWWTTMEEVLPSVHCSRTSPQNQTTQISSTPVSCSAVRWQCLRCHYLFTNNSSKQLRKTLAIPRTAKKTNNEVWTMLGECPNILHPLTSKLATCDTLDM